MGRQKGLGELEQQVLEFLWKHGPTTGEAVRAAVGKDRPLADSTIRTVLRRLEAKHFVQHDVDGTKFLYSAVHEPRKVATDAVLHVLKKFCRGSLEEMLTGLVDHRVVGTAELKRLAARIEAHEKKAGRKS
ncbi:MAG TPA: BlaI/MecI/CopY family transcriptional regulator [Vicinamibacterales bacterium]|nr:BlaI/MecI/CopY family transcriptional regulator [Vicinamibacterales bacterium]